MEQPEIGDYLVISRDSRTHPIGRHKVVGRCISCNCAHPEATSECKGFVVIGSNEMKICIWLDGVLVDGITIEKPLEDVDTTETEVNIYEA